MLPCLPCPQSLFMPPPTLPEDLTRKYKDIYASISYYVIHISRLVDRSRGLKTKCGVLELDSFAHE